MWYDKALSQEVAAQNVLLMPHEMWSYGDLSTMQGPPTEGDRAD